MFARMLTNVVNWVLMLVPTGNVSTWSVVTDVNVLMELFWTIQDEFVLVSIDPFVLKFRPTLLSTTNLTRLKTFGRCELQEQASFCRTKSQLTWTWCWSRLVVTRNNTRILYVLSWLVLTKVRTKKHDWTRDKLICHSFVWQRCQNGCHFKENSWKEFKLKKKYL